MQLPEQTRTPGRKNPPFRCCSKACNDSGPSLLASPLSPVRVVQPPLLAQATYDPLRTTRSMSEGKCNRIQLVICGRSPVPTQREQLTETLGSASSGRLGSLGELFRYRILDPTAEVHVLEPQVSHHPLSWSDSGSHRSCVTGSARRQQTFKRFVGRFRNHVRVRPELFPRRLLPDRIAAREDRCKSPQPLIRLESKLYGSELDHMRPGSDWLRLLPA